MSKIALTIPTEAWLRKHAGHDVVEEVKQISIRLMFWRVCRTCNERHLYKMGVADQENPRREQ